jgi:hypothetical protein
LPATQSRHQYGIPAHGLNIAHPPRLARNSKLDSLMETKNSCDRFPLHESALGVPDQVHRVSPRIISLCWLAALACLVAAAVVVSLLSKRLGTTVPPREAMFLGAAALLTGSLVLIVIALYFRTVAYLVFRDGLVHVRGGRRTIVGWDEITEVFEKPMYGGSHYRIVLSDGRTKSITPILPNHTELGATIVARVTEQALPQVLRFFENGGIVSFPLPVSADPPTSMNRQQAWGQIARLQLESTRQMKSVETIGAVDAGRNATRAQR